MDFDSDTYTDFHSLYDTGIDEILSQGFREIIKKEISGTELLGSIQIECFVLSRRDIARIQHHRMTKDLEKIRGNTLSNPDIIERMRGIKINCRKSFLVQNQASCAWMLLET